MARVAELHSALAPPHARRGAAGARRRRPSERHAVRDDAQRRAGRPDRERRGRRLARRARWSRSPRPRSAWPSSRPARTTRRASPQFRAATAGRPGPRPVVRVLHLVGRARRPASRSATHGQGFGRVDDVYAWAQSAGKANPAGSGQPPQPGDLIVWDEHIGIVESVAADGTIQTIEGNSSDQVSRRTYGKDGGGALGFVRMS